ncbi:MAG: MFS transporter [Alphaproteobacteria bacterium]|nr:MFS transporter [Alphaproteobacteria bacterium]
MAGVSHDTRVNALIGTGHFLSHFYVLCLPPMFLFWKDEFGVSFGELGLAVALMSGTTAVLQTPVGFLVDKHGARRFLVGGTLLMTLAMAAMGLASAYWHILALAVVSGIGNSVIHPADYAILSGSISKERMGRSFAIHTFNGNLGFAVAPPVMIWLAALVGWRESLVLVGLLGIPLVLAILLQSRILNDQAQPLNQGPKAAEGAPSGGALLMTRPMLLFFTFFLLSSMAGGGVQSWLITVLHTVHGLDLASASSALTAYMVGATAGVLVGGYFADRLSNHLLFASVAVVLAAGFVLVVGLVSMPGVVVIGMMLGGGIALGASRTPRDMMVRDASPPGQIGKVFGFVSAGLPLGGALTPVPFGWLIDHGRPDLVLVLVAGILVLSLFCAGSAQAAQKAAAHRARVAVAAE